MSIIPCDMPKSIGRACVVAILMLILTACSGQPTIDPTGTAAPPSATPPPTATSPPAAALVNGSPIWLADYQAELDRYIQAQSAAGTELATSEEAASTVINALIDLELLAQEAQRTGITLSEDEISQEIDRLSAATGASENAGAWMAANGYDLEGLRRYLSRQQLAQAAVRRLADQVPTEMEQVLARHILVADRETAEALLAQLQEGADFGELALEQSLDLSTRVDGGNLGWFPRGVLTQSSVEQAAFELQPGEISAVVESELGYHLIEVLDRDTRPLNPNDERTLRQRAVEEWLAMARQEANIELLIDN